MQSIKEYSHKALNWYLPRKGWVNFALLIVGSIVFPLYYWLYSFLFFYLLFGPLFISTNHEYIMHEYIRPRNRVIEFLCFYIIVLYSFSNLKHNKKHHMLHHIHGHKRPELDPTVQRLSGTSTWQFLLDLWVVRTGQSAVGPVNSMSHAEERLSRGAIPEDSWNFFNKHWLLIAAGTQIVWLLLFPAWTWFVFYVYPVALGMLTGRFSEVYYHKWHKNDNPVFVFLQGSQAWHQCHHATFMDRKIGPTPWEYPGSRVNKNWKYLNGQYYINKLLFKPIR